MSDATNLNQFATAEHALKYWARADGLPHRSEAEAVLLEFMPQKMTRILDLGTGNGRLLSLLRAGRSATEGVALDFSPTMLDAARSRFHGDERVQVIAHNLDHPLPDLGPFEVIVSGLAIHHCADERKRALYAEIYSALSPGGVFCNIDHVAPASAGLHARFLRARGITAAEEDPANKLAGVEVQLQWLREIGFEDVDCHWKWLELALFGGMRKV